MSNTENDLFLPDDLLEELKGSVDDIEATMDINGWIHTGSYALDRIISVKNGNVGIPTPCVVELAGAPSTGKTTLALEITRNILQDMNGFTFYGETEKRLRSDYAEVIIGEGLYDKMVPCQTRMTQVMFSKMETACRKLLKRKLAMLPALYVVDSVGSLDDIDRYKDDAKDHEAKYFKHDFGTGKAIKRCLGFAWDIISTTNAVILLLNHEHVGIELSSFKSKFGPPKKTTPGGVYKDYMAGVRLSVSTVKRIKAKGRDVGAIVKVKNTKSSVDMPFGVCEFEVRFGKGICREKDIYDTAKKLGLIYKEGGRFHFDGTEIGNRENVEETFRADPGLMDDVIEGIKEAPPSWEGEEDEDNEEE